MTRPPEQLAPDLWRIPVPLPSAMEETRLGFTNCYLVGGSDRWMLIDTGMRTDEALAAFDHGLTEAGLSWDALDVVAVTHHHPDHFGTSARVRELSGAELLIHRADAQMVFEGLWRYPTVDELVVMHGGPELNVPAASFLMTPGFEPGIPDGALADDQVFELGGRAVRVLHTPGHTPGHCCFEIGDIVLTGDHVLGKITPHVGYYPGSDDPLADFLDSLKRIGEGGYRIGLPAHGEPFLDPASRVARIVRHHEFRLTATVDALGHETLTGWEVAPRVFGDDLHGFNKYAAMFETLAHLVLGETRGQVERVVDDGVIRWRAR